jgi:hypothetical protein
VWDEFLRAGCSLEQLIKKIIWVCSFVSCTLLILIFLVAIMVRNSCAFYLQINTSLTDLVKKFIYYESPLILFKIMLSIFFFVDFEC